MIKQMTSEELIQLKLFICNFPAKVHKFLCFKAGIKK